MNELDVKEALMDMGYSNITEDSRNYRMKPIYRDSSSSTVLSVRKDTGFFIDFSKNISGSFAELVKLSLGFKNEYDAKEWVSQKNFRVKTKTEIKPKLKEQRILPPETLNHIIPNHKYWTDRGVSEETIGVFQGGIMESGRMKNRYTFPIFNYKKELIGISGRYINEIQEDSKVIKWKHIGDKSKWKYPMQYNNKLLIKLKKIILVESIGDMLALWDSGIKNTMVTFGLNISLDVLNYLLRIDANEVIISFNNDENNNSAGNIAAEKASKKLRKYFDYNAIRVNLPPKNDFGEMTKEEIREWGKTANG